MKSHQLGLLDLLGRCLLGMVGPELTDCSGHWGHWDYLDRLGAVVVVQKRHILRKLDGVDGWKLIRLPS